MKPKIFGCQFSFLKKIIKIINKFSIFNSNNHNCLENNLLKKDYLTFLDLDVMVLIINMLNDYSKNCLMLTNKKFFNFKKNIKYEEIYEYEKIKNVINQGYKFENISYSL